MKEFTRYDGEEFRKSKNGSEELLAGKFFKVYLLTNGQIMIHPSDGDFIALAFDSDELKKIIQKAEDSQSNKA